jgi:hypothetical protein
MFAARTQALELTPDRVEELRLSLNTPVVTIEGLESGPARAGLLVHRARAGHLGVTVAVHSMRSDRNVLYTLDEALEEGPSLSVGIDAALSFGESLGFLFDDDEKEQRGGDHALRLWQELLGEDPKAECLGRSAGAALPPEEPEELVLEDLVDQIPSSHFEAGGGRSLELDSGIELEPATHPIPAPEPRPKSAIPLTKFRPPAPEAEEERREGTDRRRPQRAALARVRLVRRARRSESESRNPLLRLLSAF